MEEKFKDVFDDKLVKLLGVSSFQLEPDAISSVMANRRLLISIWPQLEVELKRLTKMGVIESMEKSISFYAVILRSTVV